MPSPQFSFRLPQKDKDALIEMARVYGAASPGAFCAEVMGAICSGDLERVKALNARLLTRMGEQLSLRLNTAMDEAAAAAERKIDRHLKKGVKPRKRRPRERST